MYYTCTQYTSLVFSIFCFLSYSFYLSAFLLINPSIHASSNPSVHVSWLVLYILAISRNWKLVQGLPSHLGRENSWFQPQFVLSSPLLQCGFPQGSFSLWPLGIVECLFTQVSARLMWSTWQGVPGFWHRCSPTAMNGMPSWMFLLDIVGLGRAQCWLGRLLLFECQQRTSCGQPTPVLSYPRFWLDQTMPNPYVGLVFLYI